MKRTRKKVKVTTVGTAALSEGKATLKLAAQKGAEAGDHNRLQRGCQ